MSALGDLSAALLPPEAGGPAPERVASAARTMIAAMPASSRAAVGAGLLALEAASLVRYGRPLGRLEPGRRSALLGSLSASGALGAGAVDGLKAVVMMAAGAEEYAAEIHATATRSAPVIADPPLNLVGGAVLGPAACDAIVIGSGAGGAFAARELARAGLDVLVLEEGERWDSARLRAAGPLQRFASLYRDGGATMALGTPPIALPLGRAVGGTTVVNSGTCYRPPEAVVARWRDEHGNALAGDGYEARLADVEGAIGVGPVPAEVMGRNGELALAGAAALGWRSGPLQRNAPGCRGACQCAIGCPNNAKAGVHLNAPPGSLRGGCADRHRIAGRSGHARARARDRGAGAAPRRERGRPPSAAGDRRLRRGRDAALAAPQPAGWPPAARPRALDPPGARRRGLVRRAGVCLARGAAERRDRGAARARRDPDRGDLDAAGDGRDRLPGAGEELVTALAGAERTASLGAMIADGPSGRVLGSRRPVVVYRLSTADGARLRRALAAVARVLLAAGAEQVELGGGLAPATSTDRLDQLVAGADVRRLRLAAFHPTGTAGAGADPARHPVGPTGALRGVDGVWVADGSILPSCPGVNPQVSIMAMAGAAGAAVATA